MSTESASIVAGKLREISGNVSELSLLPRCLGASVAELRGNPQLGPHIAEALYEIYVQEDYDVPAELAKIGWFDDAYSLASRGITEQTVEDVFEELVEFVESLEKAR